YAADKPKRHRGGNELCYQLGRDTALPRAPGRHATASDDPYGRQDSKGLDRNGNLEKGDGQLEGGEFEPGDQREHREPFDARGSERAMSTRGHCRSPCTAGDTNRSAWETWFPD